MEIASVGLGHNGSGVSDAMGRPVPAPSAPRSRRRARCAVRPVHASRDPPCAYYWGGGESSTGAISLMSGSSESVSAIFV